MSSVLVVGADTASLRELWNPLLAKAGISVTAHWDWASEPHPDLPEGCDGILVVNGHAGALLEDGARALAHKSGVPFVVADEPSQAVNLLRGAGITINGATLMQVIDGQVVLPASPTNNPRWMKVISMETVQWAAQSAYDVYVSASKGDRAKVASYVLSIDKGDAPALPKGVKDILSLFQGNPCGIAIFHFMCIPAGAALAAKTSNNVYKAITGKGMDGYPTHMAAWATGRRVRGRDEPSWNESRLADANTPDEPVAGWVKSGPTPTEKEVELTLKVTELATEVGRLEGELASAKKSFAITRGKLGAKAIAITKLEDEIKAVDGPGGKVENLIKVTQDLMAEKAEALEIANKAADDLVEARAEAHDYKREFQALRLTVAIMFELGPDATLRDLYEQGYYVLKSRLYSPNADQSIGSASWSDKG